MGSGDIPLPLGEVLSGFLLLVSGYLFRASITHGKELAALQVKEQADADNIAVLQHEVATVDKRVADSRHGIRNELTVLVAQVEDRIDARFKELRDGQEALRRWLEAAQNRRTGES
jgi:hypothetical protein